MALYQCNLQNVVHGGAGWLMLWTAKPGEDSVSVSVYNTITDEYYQNNKLFNKFRFR